MHTEPDSKVVETWILNAQKGDGEAFDKLARHFLPRIRRWALVRTGDSDDADEVVQRALVQAYRRIDRFRGDSAFGSWMYTITANAAKELFRGRHSRGRALDRLRVEQQADTRSAAPEISPGGVTGLVRTFLMELSEKQRAMMDLVDFQGLTPAEASSMLGLNQNTARVHLLRARRRIRTRILEDHPTLVEDLR